VCTQERMSLGRVRIDNADLECSDHHDFPVKQKWRPEPPRFERVI